MGGLLKCLCCTVRYYWLLPVSLLTLHASVIIFICQARKKDNILRNMFFNIYVIVSFYDCLETVSVRKPMLSLIFLREFLYSLLREFNRIKRKGTRTLALRKVRSTLVLYHKLEAFLNDPGVSCFRM